MKHSKKVPLLIASLGAWLFVAPMSFGYACSKMWASDVLTGFFLMLFGFFAIQTARSWPLIASALLGLWLQLAPLFFWAPEAASYLNDTLVGMALLVLVLSGLSDGEKKGGLPPGWSFNPSDWGPRSVTVFFALIAWFLARYLASYQLGYIHAIKDPFFGDGTIKVISSSVANMFPISDAGLGAFGYSMEFLLGLIGSNQRWKTMPWISILFGMMVIPAGMISILLIILQPLLVGAWCGICLLIALCMLAMIVLTIPEMAATVQLLLKARKKGLFWSVFLHGDPSAAAASTKPIQRGKTSKFGFTLPWNLLVMVLLGAYLMGSPSLFLDQHPAADSNYVAGPLLIALSVISCCEVVRSLRFLNLIIAAGLVCSSFLMSGFTFFGWMSNLVVGIAICLLSFPSGTRRERCGI